jgi:hypothetical protein
MGRQGFDAESFSGVMTGEQKVDAQFFGGDRSPVRRFAGNESVDSIRRDACFLADLRPQSSANKEQGPTIWESKDFTKKTKRRHRRCGQLF